MMIAALFDVEGTLYTNQMGRGLIMYASVHGRPLAAYGYFPPLLPLYILRKLKLISDERLRRAAIAGLGRVLKGWTFEQANAAFEWIIHSYLLPTARPEVMARFEEHQTKGHQIVLVSGMPEPCLERLGKTLGASGVIGTPLESREGRYTGRVLGSVMVGDDKAIQTRAFFAQRRLAIDWHNSYAYGDSIHDVPLFALVGRPVAVFPDPELRALAQARQWEILG